MAARFETFQWFDGAKLKTQFGWRLVDGNGEKVAGGESYTRREDAERGAQNIIDTVLELAGCSSSSLTVPIEEV